MSEIPFVKQLGDAVETMAATAEPGRRRRSRRRLALYAAAGSLVLGGGAAATASLLFSSEEQATADIQCYQGESVERSVAQEPAEGRDPVAFCRETLGYGGQTVPPLVACAGNDTVAVPGRSPEDCERVGFKPLGTDYARYRAKVARLQRDVLALETSVDCLAPRAYAAKLQELLDRTGWVGWRAQVDETRTYRGPCGTVTGRGGRVERTIAGAFDGKAKILRVRTDISHSLDELRVAIFARFVRRSGERCFTAPELAGQVRRSFGPSGSALRVVVGPIPAGGQFAGPRGPRYEAGCAVFGSLEPEDGVDGLVLRIARKR